MMRTTLLAATWGIILLFGADHASAEYLSPPFLKLCEAARRNTAGTSPPDAPIEPGSDPGTKKTQPKPNRSAEDVALSERLQDLIANRLPQYVARPQDRIAVEAFYRGRDFVPLWVNAAGALQSTREAVDFLHGVAADGLDPKDNPTPTFADRDPTRLAAEELTLTNSIARFVRHASTGRVAFTRVSGSIYFDLKAPNLEQALESVANSDDLAATLDSFHPQQPEYKALKAELASVRRSLDTELDNASTLAQRTDTRPGDRGAQKSKAGRIDTIIANMERLRWLPRNFG